MFSFIKDINTCPKIAGKILDQYWHVAGENGCVCVGGGRVERRKKRKKTKKQKGYVESQIK